MAEDLHRPAGDGENPGTDWIRGSDDMLRAVLEFIDQVIPGGHFLLAGESYGGYMARGVLAKMPERVMGLALICPMIVPDVSKRALPPQRVIAKDEAFLSTLSPEEAGEFAFVAVVQDAAHWKRFAEEILAGVQLADTVFLERIRERYAFSFDPDDLSRPFDKPVLILTGRQDHITGYRDAWNIIENYPRGTFAVLDRAGHDLQIEQSGLFHTLVAEWLDRVEETLRG